MICLFLSSIFLVSSLLRSVSPLSDPLSLPVASFRNPQCISNLSRPTAIRLAQHLQNSQRIVREAEASESDSDFEVEEAEVESESDEDDDGMFLF